MHYTKVMIAFGTVLFLLIGCGHGMQQRDNASTLELTNISSKEIDQSISNKAKNKLQQNKNVSSVKAVNTSNKLVIAIEVPQMQRFKLKKIQKQLSKEMKKEFSNMDVHLSTDKKIIFELNQLEAKLVSNSITKKEFEKKLKHIIKLTKEKT